MSAQRRPQRGVVMILALIALVLLLIGAVAMLQTVDTSAVLVDNLAFRRDLTNRAERAIMTARIAFVSGALSGEGSRSADVGSANYSAIRLANGADGLPKVLTSDAAFTAAGMSGADIVADGVTVRYVIDRQCAAAGSFSAAGCESVETAADVGGSSWLRKPSGDKRPVYRISVRVQGPRNTTAFFQTTYSD